MKDVKNWFDLPYEEQCKLRKVLIPNPRSILDTAGVPEPCPSCDATGKCANCLGTGDMEHFCDCDLCNADFEDCDDCAGTGKCPECGGKGVFG